MAGNQTAARIRAYDAWKDAEKALGSNDITTKKLEAQFNAARQEELNAMGKNEQAHSPYF